MLFNINGYIWHLVFVEWNDPSLYRNDGSLTVGMCDSRTKTVYLNNRLEGEFLRKVIIHEICHCFVASYNVSPNIDCEERLADVIATFGDRIISLSNEILAAL